MRRNLLSILLLPLLVAACSREPVDIMFRAAWDDRPLGCDAEDPTLSDLRLYVSDVELIGPKGTARRLADLALIDLENGQGACQNGTPELAATVSGNVPPGNYRGLRFTLGVPFEQNHADPLAAQPPLDDAAMHWHWRSGYKFLRAGVRTADDGFWIHLGSAGCEGTVGNITGCRFPNRVEVVLPEFDPQSQVVSVDLEALLRGTDLSDGVTGSCSSGPAETDCEAPFRALGIDHADGSAIASQRVFAASR